MFLLRELFAIFVAQMLMISQVVPAKESTVTRRRCGRCRSRSATQGTTECSQLAPVGRGLCGLRLLGSSIRRTVASGKSAAVRRRRREVVWRRIGRRGGCGADKDPRPRADRGVHSIVDRCVGRYDHNDRERSIRRHLRRRLRRRLLLRLCHRSVALHLGIFGRSPPFVLSEMAVGQK